MLKLKGLVNTKMSKNKTVKIIGRTFIQIIILMITLFGLFIFVKELITNGVVPGEQLPYNILYGAVLFFGGMCCGEMMIIQDQEKEIKELKEELKR